MKGKRWLKIGLFFSLPIGLYLVAAERASWRPRVLPSPHRLWKGAVHSFTREIVFSPDGKMLAATGWIDGPVNANGDGWSRGFLALWDVSRRTVIAFVDEPRRTFRSVRFSPDGKRIAALRCTSGGFSDEVQIWSITKSSGEELRLSDHIAVPAGDAVWGNLSWQKPDVLQASTFFAVGQLSLKTRRWSSTPSGCLDSAQAISADGTTQVCGVEKKQGKPRHEAIEVRQRNGAGQFDTVKRLKVTGEPRLTSLVLSGNGSWLASAAWAVQQEPSQGALKLWNLRTEREQVLQPSMGHGFPTTMTFSPDCTLLAAGHHGNKIKLWDMQSYQVTRVITERFARIYSLAFSPTSDTLAASAFDGKITLWRVR